MTTALLERPGAAPGSLIDELTRRGFLAGTAAALGLGMAGCAGRENAQEEAAPPPGPTTRTVPSDNGPIEVPARPQRVVALDGFATMACLDAGITPVAVPDQISALVPPGEVERVRALEGAGLPVSPNIEAIAAFRPDLILRGRTEPDLYASLRRIAPTVAVNPADAAAWAPMIETFMEAASGAETVAAVRQRYRDRIAAVTARHGALIESTRWYLVQRFPEYTFVFGANFPGMSVYADLGIRFGAAAAAAGARMSEETIGSLADADAILVREQTGASGTGSGGLELISRDAGFTRLPAFAAGHVAASRFGLPLSYSVAGLLLDDIEALLDRLTAR